MDFHRPAQSICSGLRETDVANLAFLDQFGQGSHSFLDRRVGIDAVLVVEIDVVGPQPLQAAFAGLLHIVGLAADAAKVRIVGVTNDPELRGQNYIIAFAFKGASDEFFVLVGAVYVSGIEKVYAEFERAMNGRERFVVIAPRVELRHSHTAQSEGG